MFAIAGLVLFLWNVPNSEKKETAEKVKRPASVKNLSFEQFMNQADRLLYQGKAFEALNFYQQASQREPQEALPYEKIGDLFFFQRNYPAARQNYELSQSLSKNRAVLDIKIIRATLGMRKIFEAKSKLEAIQPATAQTLFYEGLIATFLNEQGKAKELLTESIQKTSDENLKLSAQKILTAFRDFELARDAPVELLQALLAQAFDQAGEYGLAIELGFNALKTKHDYRDVWIILGHAFLNERKWHDAEDAFSKAMSLDISHPAAVFFRGIARTNTKKIREAIEDFELALKLGWKPQILAKEYLADSFFELNKFPKAFELYREIIMTDASVIERFIRPMALAINHLKKPGEALQLAQKAVTAHPGTAMAENLLGWALLANNNFLAAREHLQAAIRQDPELDAAYLNLGQLAQAQGALQDALRYYEKAKELAEKLGNASIQETAQEKYTTIQKGKINGTNLPARNTPQMEKIIPIPSLSLL